MKHDSLRALRKVGHELDQVQRGAQPASELFFLAGSADQNRATPWHAPELLVPSPKAAEPPTAEADVFAFGMVVWQMLARVDHPWGDAVTKLELQQQQYVPRAAELTRPCLRAAHAKFAFCTLINSEWSPPVHDRHCHRYFIDAVVG